MRKQPKQVKKKRKKQKLKKKKAQKRKGKKQTGKDKKWQIPGCNTFSISSNYIIVR